MTEVPLLDGERPNRSWARVRGPSPGLEAVLGAIAAVPAGVATGAVLAGGGHVDAAAPLGLGSDGVGWLIYVVSVVGAGAAFGAGYRFRPHGFAGSVGSGVSFGLIWWMIAWLTVTPSLASGAPGWSVAEAVATFPFLVASVIGAVVTSVLFHGLGSSVIGDAAATRMMTTASATITHRIVIVGGGFGGVAVAKRLEQSLRHRPGVAVTLISEGNFLLFTPMLVSVAAGSLMARHVAAPLRANCPRTTIRQARVEAIEPDDRTVLIRASDDSPTEVIPYDQLVLAVGAVPSFRGLSDVATRAFTLKTLGDASDIRDHVLGLLDRAESEPALDARRRMLTFVVAGGGFAGVELIAELHDLVHDVLVYHPRLEPASLRFLLIHSRGRILPELPEQLGDYARSILERRGIEFALGVRVAGATDEAIRLSDDRLIEADTFVWTAGNEPAPLARSIIREAGPNLTTDAMLRVTGHLGIWAVGDCAAIPDQGGGTCPPTAQHAIRQGDLVATNIVATIDGRPLAPFRFRPLGLLVILGRSSAAAEIRGVRFSGLLAWFMWRGIYLAKLPGLEKRLRVLIDWLLDLTFPRDIVIASSPRSMEASGAARARTP